MGINAPTATARVTAATGGVLLIATVLLGCGPAAQPALPTLPAPTDAREAAPPATTGPRQAVPGVSPPPGAQPGVDAALREAAARLGADASSLSVERVEARDWSDSSLGCPQPGMMYAQVISPGYLVIVAGSGKRLELHTDAQGTRAVACREL